MLSAVTSSRARAVAGLLALSLAVAGCSSTTAGSGDTVTSATASSSPDFPTGVAGSPSGESSAPTRSVTSSGAPTSGDHPVPASPLKTVTVHAQENRTYVVEIWAQVHDDSCFDHAYGQQMIAFLIQHPCHGLDRYLGTTTVGGRPAAFAESVTGFSGTAKDPYVNSTEFTRLEEADGTGSINDLLREGYRLPSGPGAVPAAEAFNVLGQDNGVTVWDAWYLDGATRTNDSALVQMTKDIFLQF